MKNIINLILILGICCTACFHHKKTSEKNIRSHKKIIHPEIKKYHEEIQKRKASKMEEIYAPKEEECTPPINTSGPVLIEEPTECKKKSKKKGWPWDSLLNGMFKS